MRKAIIVIAGMLMLAAAAPSSALADGQCTNMAAFGTDLPGVDLSSPTPAITCSVTYECPASSSRPCTPLHVGADVDGLGQVGAWISWSGGLSLCDSAGPGLASCTAYLDNFAVQPGTSETFNCGVRSFLAARIDLRCYWDDIWL